MAVAFTSSEEDQLASISTHRKWWLAAVALAACAGTAVVHSINGRTAFQPPEADAALPEEQMTLVKAPPRLRVVRPKVVGAKRSTHQPGSITAFESVDLCAMVSGYLKTQHVDIGSRVKKGEVLAVVDVPREESLAAEAAALLKQAEAKVSQAESKVKTAEADLLAANATAAQCEADIARLVASQKLAEAQFARVRQLAEERAVDRRLVDEQKRDFESAVAAERTARLAAETARAQAAAAESRVEQAQADLEEARAAVDVAAARLKMAEVNLKYATITAPFDGVVTRRNYHPGAFIGAQVSGGAGALLTVARTDLMRVIVQVPDRDVVFANEGDPALLTIDGLDGREFRGSVARIANYEDPTTRTMRVEIDLQNREGLLRDGMYGHATIELSASSNRLMLPSDCVMDRTAKGGGAVFVVRAGKLVRVPVGLGGGEGGDVEIKTGITTDDDVVSPADATLKEGMRVEAGTGPSAA